MAECPLKDLDDKNSDRNNFEISHILPATLRKIDGDDRLRISDHGVSKLLSSDQVDRAKDNAQWLSELGEDDFLSLLKEAYRGNIKEASPGYRKILKEVEQDNVKENTRGRGASMSLSGRTHDSHRTDEIESSGPGRKSRGGSKDKIYEQLPASKRVRHVEKSNSDVGINQKQELVDINAIRNVKSSENLNTSEKESATLKSQIVDRPNHERLLDFSRGTSSKCKNKNRNQSSNSANRFTLEDANKVVDSQSTRTNKINCHSMDIYDKSVPTVQGSLRDKISGESKFTIEDKYYVDNDRNVMFDSKHKNDFLPHSAKLNAKLEESHFKTNLGAIQKDRCYSKTGRDDSIFRTEEVSYNDCSQMRTFLENSVRQEKDGDKSTKKRYGPLKLNDKKQCEFSETSSKTIKKYDSQSISDVDTIVTFPLRHSDKSDKITSGKHSNSPRSSSTVRSSNNGARDSPVSWQNHNIQRKSEGSDLSISPNNSELHSSSTTSAPERPDDVEHLEDVTEQSRQFSTYQFKEACKQLHPFLNSNHGCGYEIEMNCLDELKTKQKRKTPPDNVNEKSLSVENHAHVEKLLENQTNSNSDFENTKLNEGAMNKIIVNHMASKIFTSSDATSSSSKSSSSNSDLKTSSIPNNKLAKKKRIAPVIFLDHYKPKLVQKDFTFGFEINDELLKLGPEKYRSLSIVNKENNLCRSTLQLEDPSVLLSSSSQGHILPSETSTINNIKNKISNDKEKNLENTSIDDALGNFNYMEVLSYICKVWGDVELESEDAKMKVVFYSSD